MEYHVWAIVNGALEDDEVFSDAITREHFANHLVRVLSDAPCHFEVWVADVTPGCKVGEWEDEHAELYCEN